METRFQLVFPRYFSLNIHCCFYYSTKNSSLLAGLWAFVQLYIRKFMHVSCVDYVNVLYRKILKVTTLLNVAISSLWGWLLSKVITFGMPKTLHTKLVRRSFLKEKKRLRFFKTILMGWHSFLFKVTLSPPAESALHIWVSSRQER